MHAKGKPIGPDVDLAVIARRTPGFTGADLANVLNEAALLTARRGERLLAMGSVEEAIDHVNTYGSGHSEAIVTNDRSAARAFQLGIDSACIYVNASTRFTDGGEFGMGAEIGNSTQKLHARGPIGLRELCTFKYLIDGDGQVRA